MRSMLSSFFQGGDLFWDLHEFPQISKLSVIYYLVDKKKF